jgi:hypothetical protein
MSDAQREFGPFETQGTRACAICLLPLQQVEWRVFAQRFAK